jgi:hypothetical protein
MERVSLDAGDDEGTDEDDFEDATNGERRLQEATSIDESVKPTWLRSRKRSSGISMRDEVGKRRVEMATPSTKGLSVSDLAGDLAAEKDGVVNLAEQTRERVQKPLISMKDERGIDRVALDATTEPKKSLVNNLMVVDEDAGSADTVFNVRPKPRPFGPPRPAKLPPTNGLVVMDEYGKPRIELASEDERQNMTRKELLQDLKAAASGEGDASAVRPKEARPSAKPLFRVRDKRGMERVSLDAGDEDDSDEEEEDNLEEPGHASIREAPITPPRHVALPPFFTNPALCLQLNCRQTLVLSSPRSSTTCLPHSLVSRSLAHLPLVCRPLPQALVA